MIAVNLYGIEAIVAKKVNISTPNEVFALFDFIASLRTSHSGVMSIQAARHGHAKFPCFSFSSVGQQGFFIQFYYQQEGVGLWMTARQPGFQGPYFEISYEGSVPGMFPAQFGEGVYLSNHLLVRATRVSHLLKQAKAYIVSGKEFRVTDEWVILEM